MFPLYNNKILHLIKYNHTYLWTIVKYFNTCVLYMLIKSL